MPFKRPDSLTMTRSILALGFLSGIALQSATAQQPTLVRDFWPGEVFNGLLNHGRPNGFRVHNNSLLLFANESLGASKLFRLNDLSGTAQELADVGGPAGYTTTNGGIVTSGDNIYFFAQQTGSTNHLLWCVRPGQAAEQLAVIPYSILYGYVGIPLSDGRLLFPGHDAASGYELWITDGTTGGTQRLKDINPGTGTPFGSPFPVFQGFDFHGKAYFMANDGTNGPQLWVSDGTEAGTVQFATINPPSATGSITLLWSKNNERFVVTANTGLIASDGTTAGTSLIHPGSYAMAHIPGLNYHTANNGYMYFSVLESGDWKLYRTQGTAASTQMVLDDVVPNQGYPYLTELNGMLYVFGLNGDQNTVLLRIDPTAQEATLVKTFLPGPDQSFNGITNFYGFRTDGQHFYFMGREGAHARQYWKSDGTEAGTAMVHTFTPTLINGGPDAADGNMIIFNNTFVYSANDPGVGLELFAAEGVVGVDEPVAGQTPFARAWCNTEGQLTVLAHDGELLGVRVLDLSGRVVLNRRGHSSDRLQLSHGRPAGLYMVEARTTRGTSLLKVVLF